MAEPSETIGGKYLDYVETFFAFLFDPSDRLFFLYLLSSLFIVFILYRISKNKDGFFRFVFPKSVWNHPSAWLDVRYFFFHGLLGHFFVHLVIGGIFVLGMSYTVSSDTLQNLADLNDYSSAYRAFIALMAMLVLAIISDFIGFFLHYLQHKVPLLWQFHKVHHSSEVMHPLSNFREHPVDNLVYQFFNSLFMGASWGLILTLVGFRPDAIEIFGVGAVSVLFNLTGYQLRHSHIWLRWPGVWSKVFPSPAHHHVHHSRHPDHLDKNFAFLFPFWDVLFGTYEMPEDNRDVEFGIVEDASDLNSCVNLYVIPFRDAFRLFKNKKKPDVASPSAKLDPLS